MYKYVVILEDIWEAAGLIFLNVVTAYRLAIKYRQKVPC